MSFWKNRRVLVTGGTGFLGNSLVPKLEDCDAIIFTPGGKEFDLTKEKNVESVFQNFKAEIVIHLAADFGGIGYLKSTRGKVYFNNVMMNTLLVEKARQYNVDKFVGINTVYCYPGNAEMPLKEEDLWKGRPEKNLASYGLSKRMMIFQSEVYREQYGFNSINLLFSNIYGPHDNFDLNSAGIIPATIRKCIEAKNNNNDHITLWGTGKPTRDNLYVEDAADAIILATERYNKSDPVNIGGGIEVSIRELVNLIAELTGFTGKMIFDTSKPDGQLRQCVDTSKAKKEFGFEAKTDLKEGLKKTIKWYMENK
ncbi:MAG: NAD-dependent epimerase/dehydratase family protein [Methanocellales archaeon]|nr:NAD-dependent epimerase/dehydratase family protein [Methanocellales archaeon]MDD4897830.1 NAD-dependent epimerase/dehydratase family protein [Methanocellales archaeon]MDD5446389.1 NAD-dependent epimerase/dehydratase family protein [Methanocellales archaeon]